MNLELGDVRSALDRLMDGVDTRYNNNSSALNSTETSDDEDRPLALLHGGRLSGIHSQGSPIMPGLQRNSTAMSGNSTQSTEEAVTPPLGENLTVDIVPGQRPLSATITKDLPALPPPASPPTTHSKLDAYDEVLNNATSRLSAPFPPAPMRRSTIRRREEAIKAKRREQRAAEGRPTRRRSSSTGNTRVVRF